MTADARVPFRSLRDLVLKELQGRNSLLTWNRDSSFTDHVLSSLLDSEAYLLDRSARSYLTELSSDLSQEEYFRSIANTRMPFESVWIETIREIEEHEGREGKKPEMCSDGALIIDTDEGIKFLAVTARHNLKPWTVMYAGAEVCFCPDGEVRCSKTPSSNLYDRLARSDGHSQKDMMMRDIDASLRIGGLFAILCAVLNRKNILDAEAPKQLRLTERKTFERASREPPRYGISVIRLSKIGKAKHANERTDGVGGNETQRTAHWVRGHMFLARNGKLTWRRPHIRGTGTEPVRVYRVTE